MKIHIFDNESNQTTTEKWFENIIGTLLIVLAFIITHFAFEYIMKTLTQ